MSEHVLKLTSVSAGYSGVPSVRDVSLSVQAGEILALVGANGAGKTTLVRTAMGLHPLDTGLAEICGERVSHRRPHRSAHAGAALVPDDRGLFGDLTVEEHLRLTRGRGPHLQSALSRFPVLSALRKRKVGLLSGGEQQMLAIACALASGPRLLAVDEMSMGLAPIVVGEMLSHLKNLTQSEGIGILLVEQHVTLALEVADSVAVMHRGRLVLHEDATQLRRAPEPLKAAYFGQQ